MTLIQDVYISLKMYGSTVEPIVDFSKMSEDECAATVTTTPIFSDGFSPKEKNETYERVYMREFATPYLY